MEINATEFRRTLFKALDQAVRGEVVAVHYRGTRILLNAEQGGSKLARAVRRHALKVDPDAIVNSDVELMEELDAKWRAEDEQL